MKNITKALGIAGLTALSFLPLKSWGQDIKKDSLELSNENGRYM